MLKFDWLLGIIGGFLVACLGENYLVFRPQLGDKFIAKEDCVEVAGRIYRENREEHIAIFKELKGIHKDISETKIMIMKKLNRDE